MMIVIKKVDKWYYHHLIKAILTYIFYIASQIYNVNNMVSYR